MGTSQVAQLDDLSEPVRRFSSGAPMRWLIGISVVLLVAWLGVAVLRAAILARALTRLFFKRARSADIDRFRLRSAFWDGEHIYFARFFTTDFARACSADPELSVLRHKTVRAYWQVPLAIGLGFLLVVGGMAILSAIGGQAWHRV